ncbi:transcriptional regulator of RNA polII, SAGA, subunit-domain-containing protein [Terfezia claveryi]|nr:transcriptional regulator of RNA polII, SAGA, subunit-domain-containing protein [Terfezia claveryi]
MSPDSSHSSATLTNGVSTSTSLTLPNTSSSSTSVNSSNNASNKKPPDASGGGGGVGTAPPRVDLEPIYEGLRAGLTLEQWLRYKEALSSYVLGRINRQELSTAIDPIITGPKQRQHNQLLMGILTNATSRDAPPHEIAPYVLATNRASTTLSRGLRGGLSNPTDSGDSRVEARLKTEVMSLARRDRRRIKEVPESLNPEDILPSLLLSYHQAKQIKIPDPEIPPQSATPNALNNKTNWEAEIKSRYSMPLACESGEFPDLDGIRMRMLPICYEEGVVGGVGEATAQFMNVAAEVFVKEVLSSVISRVRCNRTTTIKTDGFKRKMEKMLEEQGSGVFGFESGITLNLNGSINTMNNPNNTSPSRKRKRQKLANGRPNHRPNQPHNFPPPELAGERKVLCMNDLRLSFTLGDSFLSQLPLSLNRIMAGGWERPEDYYVAAEFGGMPPPALPRDRGRNQPNFAKRKSTAQEKHASMLDAFAAGVEQRPPPSPVLGNAQIVSQPVQQEAQHAGEEGFLWNDGFEPWGPDAGGWVVGGRLGAPGQLPVGPDVDINEIINGWEFYPPHPQAGGMGIGVGMGVGRGMGMGMGMGMGVGMEWAGAGADERRELRGLLDDCLAVGM